MTTTGMQTARFSDSFIATNMPEPALWPSFINEKVRSEPFNCVAELVDNAVAEGHGDRVAISAAGVAWTYRDLTEKTNQIANVLVEDMGLVTGNRVLLRSANNPMLAACWLAVIKAGGVVVTTIAMLRSQEIAKILDQSQAYLVLCDARVKKDVELLEEGGSTFTSLYFNDSSANNNSLEARMAQKSSHFDSFQSDGTDIAILAFTSGTTGRPKGAMHSHAAVMAVCETFSETVLKPTQSDVFTGTPPLGFVYGLGGILLFPLHARASTVLLGDVRVPALMAAINEFKVSILFTAPTAYKALLENYDANLLNSLRMGVSAGEALPNFVTEGWLDKAGIRLIDGIGSTELLHIFLTVKDDNDPVGSLGTPVSGYEARIVDEQGNELPIDTVGLLAVRGPTGCRYLNDPRQQKYVVGGWNITGDAAMQDANGYFWYQARIDGMIVSSGYNIAAPDVEQTLGQHPAVAECAVIGIEDKDRGHIVRAYIVLREGFEASAGLVKDIQNFCKQKAAPYKYPRSVEFIDVIPRTLTGKVQHFVLRELAQSQAN